MLGPILGKTGDAAGTPVDGGMGLNNAIGIGFAEYRDGTSNTVFIAENLTGVDLFDGGGPGAAATDALQNRGTYTTYGTAVGKTGNLLAAAQGDLPEVLAQDLASVTAVQRVTGVSTPHSGGVFGVAMADGSSTFLNGNIEQRTFAAMCTRNASDTIGDY